MCSVGDGMKKTVTLEKTQKAEAGFLEIDFDISFCSLGEGDTTVHRDLLINLEQCVREH